MGKVAVHGSYHADNFGDTLLVRLIGDMIAGHVGRENVALAMPGQPAEQRAIGYPVLAPEERGQVELLVYGGGGYFSQHAGNPLRTILSTRRRNGRHLDWLPQFAHSRKAMIGVGVGPISFHRSIRSSGSWGSTEARGCRGVLSRMGRLRTSIWGTSQVGTSLSRPRAPR